MEQQVRKERPHVCRHQLWILHRDEVAAAPQNGVTPKVSEVAANCRLHGEFLPGRRDTKFEKVHPSAAS
jgi:hypothetical protein